MFSIYSPFSSLRIPSVTFLRSPLSSLSSSPSSLRSLLCSFSNFSTCSSYPSTSLYNRKYYPSLVSRSHNSPLSSSSLCTLYSIPKRYVNFEGKRKFIDKIRIQVIGGKGGKGVVSFDHVTNWKRKPMGGTGGKGGDIIIETNISCQDLNFQTYIIRGRPGKDATGNKGSNGRDGKMKKIMVPVGTIIKEITRSYILDESDAIENDQESLRLQQQESGLLNKGKKYTKNKKNTVDADTNNEKSENISIITVPSSSIDKLRSKRSIIQNNDYAASIENTSSPNTPNINTTNLVKMNRKGLPYREKITILGDLNIPGQKILVARGGHPGVGNRGSFLTYSEQKDEDLKAHIEGGKGEVRFLELELKTIADIGLVGFPNAGKSSFLTTISKVSIHDRYIDIDIDIDID